MDLVVKKHKFPRCAVLALGRPLTMEDKSKQAQAVCLSLTSRAHVRCCADLRFVEVTLEVCVL